MAILSFLFEKIKIPKMAHSYNLTRLRYFDLEISGFKLLN